jgi:hypothetical protein
MSLALGALAGERSVLDYLNRAGCTVAMMFCGYLSERHRESSYFYFLMGVFFAVMPFIQDVVLLSAVPSSLIPPFVTAIIATMYIFFFSFTFPALYEIWTFATYGCKGSSYLQTEKSYMFLSLTSKTFMDMYILFAQP